MDSAKTSLRGRLSSGLIVGVAALFFVGLVGPSALAQGTGKVESYTIVMKNYSYTPDHMTWHVGDTVQITLKNDSADKSHEFLIGRDVKYSKDAFGKKYPDGFKTVLLDSRKLVSFGSGEKIAELQTDEAASAALEDQGGTVTLSFVVPDKVGKWTFGCFMENGSHFADHNMKGTIDIVK